DYDVIHVSYCKGSYVHSHNLQEQRRPSGPLSVFSTMNAPIEERVPLWEDETRETMLGLRVSSFANESMSSAMLNSSLDSVKLTAMKCNEHVVERSDALLKTSQADVIVFCLLNKGTAFYYGRQGMTNLREMDAVIYDADTPFLYAFGSSMAQYVYQIPRSEFYRMTGRQTLDEPLFFRGSQSPMLAASRRIFTSTIRAFRAGKNVDPGQIEQTFMGVFEYLVGSEHQNPDAVYFTAAKEFIDEQWYWPDLAVKDVAKAVGISERQIARVFSANNLSIGKYISDIRLENSYKLLTIRGAEKMSIGQLAQHAGFRHASQFSRAFKRKYGITPRDA